MNQSETIEKLAEALAKAQGQIGSFKTDGKAQVRSEKGNFSYKYATLTAVLDACRAPLSENGLSIVQFTEGGPADVTVTTRLIHSSGQWLESSLTVRATKPDAQGLGSAITYGRRYSLMAMVGIAPEDDDGQAACQPTEQPARPAAKPPQRPQPIPAAGGPAPETPSFQAEAKHYALEITRMINAGLITQDDVRVYGSLPSISAAKDAGDVNSLKQAHILLQEYVHARNKELAAAS